MNGVGGAKNTSDDLVAVLMRGGAVCGLSGAEEPSGDALKEGTQSAVRKGSGRDRAPDVSTPPGRSTRPYQDSRNGQFSRAGP